MIVRAQVQYRGPRLRSQQEAEEKFRAWQRGELKDGAFNVLVWGRSQGRNGLCGRAVGRLHLGTMGRVKMYADPRVTMVDLDRRRPPTLERVFRVARTLGVKVSWVRMERSSSGNWHLIVRWVDRFTKAEIVAIQAMLGSDWKREMFNLYRVRAGVKSRRWNFLFEEKLK